MTDFPVGSPLPGALGSGRREALTVAQLLSRMTTGRSPSYTPVAREYRPSSTAASEVVSVGSLLRREGRAPHAQDRPLQPRAARQAEQAEQSGAWQAAPSSGRRRATAVAGAIVAVGSVLGAALYNGAASHSSEAQAAADGLFPGLGLPAGAGGGLPAGYLPSNVALASPIPASVLTPGATDWMKLAFPATTSGSAGGTLAAASAVPTSFRSAVPEARDAAASAPGRDGGGTGGSGGGLLPSLPIVSDPGRAPAGNVLDPVLGGGSTGDGGQGPVRTLTEPLRPVGETVGQVLQPVGNATAPVGDALGGVIGPVGRAAQPLTSALRPVTRPLADTLEPVTSPVLGGLQPVTGPVLNGTRPLTGPVLDALEPVTGLLDTSAAGNRKSGTSGPGKHALTGSTDPANTVSGLTGRLGLLGGSGTGSKSGGSVLDGVTSGGSLLGGLTSGGTKATTARTDGAKTDGGSVLDGVTSGGSVLSSLTSGGTKTDSTKTDSTKTDSSTTGGAKSGGGSKSGGSGLGSVLGGLTG